MLVYQRVWDMGLWDVPQKKSATCSMGCSARQIRLPYELWKPYMCHVKSTVYQNKKLTYFHVMKRNVGHLSNVQKASVLLILVGS
jgi:hypothetical protein